MTIIIEDTARNNLVTWTLEAVDRGLADGAVITPFTTPRLHAGYKQSARQTADRLRDGPATAWFDPMTHALQMPNVGDLRYYADWDLWGGMTGALLTDADRQDHVRRVFAIQDELAVPHLAPTILLHSAQSQTSQRALQLAEVAVHLDPGCRLSVAGDAAFWSAGAALDAHVGGLAQLEPAAWALTVVRGLTILPVQAAAEEVHGLCRTTRSLSEDGPVHISHGDLAALPAVVAGATSVGTGWDPRQRVCAYASYVQRDAAGDGGQWFVQSTLEGLLSLLGRADAQLLASQAPQLAARLLPGSVPPGPQEAFLHHATVLDAVIARLSPPGQPAFQELRARYAAAQVDWDAVVQAIGGNSRAGAWLAELINGLELFAVTEGW